MSLILPSNPNLGVEFVQWYQGVWLRHYTPATSRSVSGKSETLANITVSNATKRRLAGASKM